MQCKCGGTTRVVDSRQREPTIITRRRVCDACGDRFSTWESTLDVSRLRARQRRVVKDRYANMDPEARAALQAKHLDKRRVARKVLSEARARGVSTKAIRAEWGLDGPGTGAA